MTRSRVDVDPRPLADEVIAQARHLDVGDDSSAADLRVDEADLALAHFSAGVRWRAPGADEHRVAGAHELRVALRQFQTQDVSIFGEGRDRLARQNDLTGGNRHAQDATGAGRQHRPFARLLGDDAAIGLHRRQGAFGDVEIGLGLIELGLGADAASQELRDAIEIGLGLVALRLLRGDARIQRLHLQRELLIRDDRNLGACRDRVALLDRERGDRAADARSRDELMDRLNRRDDGLAVSDLRRADDERLGRQSARRGEQGENQRQGTAHRLRLQKRP